MSNLYTMRYVLFMGINKWHFPQFIGGLQNSIRVRNPSKMLLIQVDPGLRLPNVTLIRSSLLLRKMRLSLSNSWHKRQTVQFIRKKIPKVTKISARRIPYLFTDEPKRIRVQMTKHLLKRHPKCQKQMFATLLL